MKCQRRIPDSGEIPRLQDVGCPLLAGCMQNVGGVSRFRIIDNGSLEKHNFESLRERLETVN